MGRTRTTNAIATEGRGIKMILPYVFVAAVVVLGVGLWIWPTLFSNEAITPSDVRALGNQVLGGAVVAAAILIAERAINARYEEEQANKAVIRKVLKACTRKAVTTQMNAQTNYPAMFKGITECRISVQQILPEIRVENQQLIGDEEHYC